MSRVPGNRARAADEQISRRSAVSWRFSVAQRLHRQETVARCTLGVIGWRRLSIFCRGACAKRLVFDTNAATTSALSSLRATPETDNCGGALWLASSARASSLLRSACYSFAYPAKNIRSARCRTSSGNRPIQQKSGRRRQKKILANLRLRPVRPKVFRTKLASQRRSHG